MMTRGNHDLTSGVTVLAGVIFIMFHATAGASSQDYPPAERRTASPGGATYYIDPGRGSDAQSGLSEDYAWRTFDRVNGLALAPGDQVKIIAPGSFHQTLVVCGAGAPTAPIRISFAPGRYDFFPDGALRRKYQISNANDEPDAGKAIGVLLDGVSHVEISGAGALLVYRGKMIEVCIENGQDITISGLQFDYHRPTVSEFRVTATEADRADIEVHGDSKYEIKDGRVAWVGEGWSYATGLAQELNLDTNEIWRRGDPLDGLRLEETRPGHLRAVGEHDMTPGRVYQLRDTRRDCAGVFICRSRDIVWRNVDFLFMHGMGIVCQFSENLTFDAVSIAPSLESGRTCAAWADCLHISGCRGKVAVKNCTFCGSHDDPINVHGTHLRVVQQVSEMRVRVRFMHPQTFGFMAFNPGDEITFVRWDSLETYGANVIKDADLLDPGVMLLTLERPGPTDLHENDAIENLTWTPEVTISGCRVMRTPTRGFLLTTRRKVIVEDNDFHRTHMSAILVENDARGWFESGPVRDMTIRGNRFFHCAEPVINVNPQNAVANPAVHRDIVVEGNLFALSGPPAIRGRSVTGLKVVGNTFHSDPPLDDQLTVQTSDCADVETEGNRYAPLSDWNGPSQESGRGGSVTAEQDDGTKTRRP